MRKPVCGGVRPDKTQTGLLNFRRASLERNFGCSNHRYCTVQAANDKAADQAVRICIFVVCIWHISRFSHDEAQFEYL